MTTREEIYAPLYELTDNITWAGGTYDTFLTRGRKLKLFSDVPKTEQPAIYQAEHGEQFGQASGMPYKRIFKASWIGYFPSDGIDGSIEMNLILDAIEARLAPVVQDEGYFERRNTLLGRCYHCFIDGEVFKDPGDIDNQAMFVVPIKMLVP